MPKVPKEVLVYWKNFKDADGKNTPLDPAKMTEVRRRCYYDHEFLMKALGRYTLFDQDVHGELWSSEQRDGFFLKKNPDIQPFQAFADQDRETHDRALFLPRNGLKSTANIVDLVQFVICWPEIQILIVSGKQDVANDFIRELAEHFERQDTGQPRVWHGEYSLFQMAFPEFCIDGEGPKTSYTAPCREGGRQETVSVAAIEMSMSGPHYDVIVFDDPVTNENSKTPTRLISIRNQISYFRKMMNPYGYCTFIGTWYSPQDHYGFLIRAEEENRTLFWDKGSAFSRNVAGKDMMTKILLRPAMWPKGDKSIDIDGAIEEQDWVLWFPKRLTWKWLMKERGTNRELFHSQLMNNPNLSKSVRFVRDMLVKQTKPFNELPDLHSGMGLIVQAWDTAYSDSTMANYTAGFTGLILHGRYYLLDLVHGQFSDLDLPRVMAESMQKWRPHRVVLEETNGVRWLAREIRHEMERMNFYVQIEFAEVENKKNRKSIMAAPVSRLFGEQRIILSNAIPYLDRLYDELEGFQNGAPNDDIVDAMSLLVNYFQWVPEASHMALRSEIDEEQTRRRNREKYNHIFGIGTGDFGIESQTENRSGEQLPSWVTYSPMDAFE